MKITFYKYWSKVDDRSKFANKIFSLIYQKHKGDLGNCIDECEQYKFYLDEHVRNIYELVDDEIPLMRYCELINSKPEDYDLTKDEYQELLKIIEERCHWLYKQL